MWQAQRDGSLPATDGSGFADPALEQQRRIVRSAMALNGFRKRIEATDEAPSLSVVLLQPVLWSRFEGGAGALRLRVHEPGPGAGDAVLVTDAAVLAALAESRIDMHQAQIWACCGCTVRRRQCTKSNGCSTGWRRSTNKPLKPEPLRETTILHPCNTTLCVPPR